MDSAAAGDNPMNDEKASLKSELGLESLLYRNNRGTPPSDEPAYC